MFKTLRKYHILFFAILTTIVFSGYFFQTFYSNHQSSVQHFNNHFIELEDKLDNFIRYRSEELRHNDDISTLWRSSFEDNTINLHVYRNDSLIFWNTNQLPIIRFANIHFPTEGVFHLQNGWYFSKIKHVNDYLICASFLIKQDYSYKNSELINSFNENLHLSFKANISLDREVGFPIYSKNNDYIFSILPNSYQSASRNQSIALTILLLLCFSLWLYWISIIQHQWKSIFSYSVPFVIVILRIASLKYNWFGFMHGTLAFDPSLYGTSVWFPNFFEYLINVSIFIYLQNELGLFLKSLRINRQNKYIALFFFVTSFSLWGLFLYLTKGLIENSSIEMVIDELFSLDFFSITALASLGVLFYSYFIFVKTIISVCQKQELTGAQLAVISFFMSCSFFFYEIYLGNQLLLAAVFPVVFYELVLYIVYRQDKKSPLSVGIFLLFIFSIVSASIVDEFNLRKEKSERELYANQLITEKNVVTEVEYSQVAKKLKSDHFLQRFIAEPRKISKSNFQEGLERRVFNGYWERYELNFHLFDEQHLPLIDKVKENTTQYDELNSIIQKSGTQSEIDSSIFFIEDYTKQYSYIIRQELEGRRGKKAILFITLKSKKIPEEIGFPRLLISSRSNVLESLESYSIARYHEKGLITRYGEFNYPSSPLWIIPEKIKHKGFFNYNGYNHFALIKNNHDIVILSVKNRTFVDFITSFSYLFTLYGLLLLPFLFRLNSQDGFSKTMTLALKIQVVLISLVFISLLAFGWGSGLFVTSQYNQLTNDVIREKLNSVETEVQTKLGQNVQLNIIDDGNYTQYILQKFARVFFTDINLYDTDGYLLATSRPKVFNVGLLSEQMNPEAYKHLKFLRQSEFIHKESIGELDYSSAYKPFYNKNGILLGYINLQHFGQQREFEHQIQQFLVAIVNVFILLLAISIILAIFFSNWLTAPLRLLQKSFANVEFGKTNEPIHYNKEDEIGSLVQDYNRKLEELEFTAQQLAKSERESAWREMAKQVAHEIKNPLTPMKLSIQQLLRAHNPEDPKSGEKLKSVANSIIEQIDALTKIANEFSNFAKMPNPFEEELDIIALIEGVKEVFENDENEIILKTELEELAITADRNQFVRVFNNLIKNAIQAIPKGKKGRIVIKINKSEDSLFISIIDNGVGIEKEKQSKIFVPYFTTKSTGTGLGLAMVRQIIENHHGEIDFETKQGKGTTFTIRLPLTQKTRESFSD